MIKNPLISIIISAYNAESKIGKSLRALLKQTYNQIEIIVVDDGSTDKTKEIVKKFVDNKKIFLLEQKRQGPGAAKNKASKKAKGKILVFVDSDEYPRENYIEKLTAPIRSGEAKTSVGSWRVAKPESPWARCRFNNTYKLRDKAVMSGVFRAVDIKFFKGLKGFDTTKGYSDDRIPIKEKRARVKDAIYAHDVESTLGELYEKRKWIGSSIKTNPKPLKFKLKIFSVIIFLALFTYMLFTYPIFSLYLLLIPFILLLIKSMKKVIFYGDPLLLVYYPIYVLVIIMGMLVGFIKPVYRN